MPSRPRQQIGIFFSSRLLHICDADIYDKKVSTAQRLLGIYPILLMGHRPVCKLLIDGNYIEVGARPSYLSLSLALSKKLIAAVGAN